MGFVEHPAALPPDPEPYHVQPHHDHDKPTRNNRAYYKKYCTKYLSVRGFSAEMGHPQLPNWIHKGKGATSAYWLD